MSPLDRRPHITDRMMPEVIHNPPPDRIAFHTSPVFELQFCVRNNHKSVLHTESDRFISAFQVCFDLQLVHILQESVDYQGPSPCERDSGKTHKALPPATPHKVSDHHPDIYLLWYPSTYRHPYQSSTWPSIPIAASTIGEPVGIMCGCTGPVGISPLDLVHCAIDNVVVWTLMHLSQTVFSRFSRASSSRLFFGIGKSTLSRCSPYAYLSEC